tara:strand:- start:38 stop:400 length:363 start_codon:yes stop_codon:yes gene_type:complete
MKFKPEDLVIDSVSASVLAELTPMNENVIIRVIENEPVSDGGIVLTTASVEKSTLGVVLAPNLISFSRDGSERKPVLKEGDIVRLQRGNVGTGMPEAPNGQKWLAVPEDVIYYYRRINKG